MFFFSNLKKSLKKFKINKNINIFRNEIIENYNSTFINEKSPYFIETFNNYIDKCIVLTKVNSTFESDIINMFNEDWRLLSLKLLEDFEPIYISDVEKK